MFVPDFPLLGHNLSFEAAKELHADLGAYLALVEQHADHDPSSDPVREHVKEVWPGFCCRTHPQEPDTICIRPDKHWESA